MFTSVQCRILKAIAPRTPDSPGKNCSRSRIATLLGREFLAGITGKTVIDFGCGEGADAIEIARQGARRVIGVDIREEVLESARQQAAAAGVQDRCLFGQEATERADIVVSVDAFEHFADPAGVLRMMDAILQPSGEVWISFGPTWYHPLGGHLFSVFPWAHLIFSETALLQWRSEFKADGATRFSDVAGGLNQMTIRRFEELVAASPFTPAAMELVPIGKLRMVHNRLTRECTTSVVRCRLIKRK